MKIIIIIVTWATKRVKWKHCDWVEANYTRFEKFFHIHFVAFPPPSSLPCLCFVEFCDLPQLKRATSHVHRQWNSRLNVELKLLPRFAHIYSLDGTQHTHTFKILFSAGECVSVLSCTTSLPPPAMRIHEMQNKWQIFFEVVHILLDFVFHFTFAYLSLSLSTSPITHRIRVFYGCARFIAPNHALASVGDARRSFTLSQFVFLLRCEFTVLRIPLFIIFVGFVSRRANGIYVHRVFADVLQHHRAHTPQPTGI